MSRRLLPGLLWSAPHQGVGLRRLALLLLVAAGLLASSQARAQDQDEIFQVNGAQVVLALPLDGDASPRDVAMARARRHAFDLLMARMVSDEDRRIHAPFLKEVARGAADLVDRLVVRSERRRQVGTRTDFILSADVAFKREAVRAALASGGFPYNETPYPATLLLLGIADGQNGGRLLGPAQPFGAVLIRRAAAGGIQLNEPLGDLDDMSRLDWGPVASGEEALRQWIQGRYGLARVWLVWSGDGDFLGGAPSGGRVRPFGEVTLLENPGGDDSRQLQFRAQEGCAQAADPFACLAEAISGRIVEVVTARWIENHALSSDRSRTITLRVAHNLQIAAYNALVNALNTLPGGGALRHGSLRARESILYLDYQGREAELIEALKRLGWRATAGDGEMIVRQDG